MKKALLTIATAALWIAAAAVPAKPGLRIVAQPDGSQLEVVAHGDERFHVLGTSDGLAVGQAPTGEYRYLEADGSLSAVAAHNPGSRSAAEMQFVESRTEGLSLASAMQRGARSPRRAPARTPAKKATQVPVTGSPRVPILLVAYKDVNFRDGSNAKATFTDFFSTGTMSCRQYFVDQSNGRYTPQFDVYGPVTLTSNRATYGGNDSWGNDKGVGRMVAEACQGLNSQIDFSRYDNNGDGECDVVIILYAGVGEASSGVSNSVWPCQWDLGSSDYGRSLTLDGTSVTKFAVFNESHSYDGGQIDGVGTFCHEFSHCLGLPDFYETTYSSGYFGMGPWSLMDTGCYNNDGYTPIGYSAYEKAFMNWIDIPEAVEGTRYTLTPMNQGSAATDQALKVTNSRDANEYYILENRALTGWDAYMPTDGMLITHVTFSQSAWDSNTVNNYSLQRMTPIPADGQLKMDVSYGYASPNPESLLGDLWPYGNATELTDTSTPPAAVNTGSRMGKPITDISRLSNGNVTFRFVLDHDPEPEPEPEPQPDDLAWTMADATLIKGQTATLQVAMTNPSVEISAFQCDIDMPQGISVVSETEGDESFYVIDLTDRATRSHQLSAAMLDGMVRVVCYSSSSKPLSGNSGALFTIKVESPDGEGEYPVALRNIILSTPEGRQYTLDDIDATVTVLTTVPGDANGDGFINVTDIVSIANAILLRPDSNFSAAAADVNADGVVNITDIVAVVRIILAQQ